MMGITVAAPCIGPRHLGRTGRGSGVTPSRASLLIAVCRPVGSPRTLAPGGLEFGRAVFRTIRGTVQLAFGFRFPESGCRG